MLKTNYNLEYYNQYDYLQKNNKTSIFHNGHVNRIRVAFVESDISEKSLNSQLKSFLFAYIMNEHFPLIQRQIKNLNKNGESSERFSLNYDYTNDREIISFLKYIYFESMTNNLTKNFKFFTLNNSNYIRFTIPVEKLIKVQDISQYVVVDLKNTLVYFEFHLNCEISDVNELMNVFPFWMND